MHDKPKTFTFVNYRNLILLYQKVTLKKSQWNIILEHVNIMWCLSHWFTWIRSYLATMNYLLNCMYAFVLTVTKIAIALLSSYNKTLQILNISECNSSLQHKNLIVCWLQYQRGHLSYIQCVCDFVTPLHSTGLYMVHKILVFAMRRLTGFTVSRHTFAEVKLPSIQTLQSICNYIWLKLQRENCYAPSQ